MKRYLCIHLLLSVFVLAGSMAEPAGGGQAAPGAADSGKLAQASNEFALALYGRLRQDSGNLICSPYSISRAVAMTYAGARGLTAEEIARTLRFPFGQERLHSAFGSLTGELRGGADGRTHQLDIADALWGQKGQAFLPGFRKTLEAHYGARLGEVDFRGNPGEARQVINRWAEERTKGKIRDLLAEKDVGSETELVLTNTIYFLAAWEKQFDRKSTSDAEFLAHGKTKPSVPMMNQTGTFPYAEGEGCQVLELTYKGEELGMVLLLPNKGSGLAALEQNLTADRLRKLLLGVKPQTVNVALPRFRFSKDLRLKDELSDLGMSSAFGPAADFSSMTGKKGLSLSEVIHQAFVDVREEGTEAAAATAAPVGRERPRISFRADRPFLFLIRHRPTGSILFLGRLVDPK